MATNIPGAILDSLHFTDIFSFNWNILEKDQKIRILLVLRSKNSLSSVKNKE